MSIVVSPDEYVIPYMKDGSGIIISQNISSADGENFILTKTETCKKSRKKLKSVKCKYQTNHVGNYESYCTLKSSSCMFHSRDIGLLLKFMCEN